MNLTLGGDTPYAAVLTVAVCAVLIAWLARAPVVDQVTIDMLECAAACEHTGIAEWSITSCRCVTEQLSSGSL